MMDEHPAPWRGKMTLFFARRRGLRRWELRWYELRRRFWTRRGCRSYAAEKGYRAGFFGGDR